MPVYASEMCDFHTIHMYRCIKIALCGVMRYKALTLIPCFLIFIIKEEMFIGYLDFLFLLTYKPVAYDKTHLINN